MIFSMFADQPLVPPIQKALSLDLDAADTKHKTSRALVFCKYRRLHTLFQRGVGHRNEGSKINL